MVTLLLGIVLLLTSSCATLLGGTVSADQARKPIPGEQQRQLRVITLMADVVVFALGAIYSPKES